MSFLKKDYIEARRKRNAIISVVTAAAIVVIVVSYNLFIKESPQEDALPDSQPAVTAKETEPALDSSGEITTKDLPAIIKVTSQSVVLVQTFDRKGNKVGVGSGFFVSESGDIISNRHVFRDAFSAEVKTNKGKKFPIAKVLAQNMDYDLVRLSLGRTGKKFKPLKMSNSVPQVGESIMVIGNPLGLSATVSNGIVSAMREFPPLGTVIQITCPISPGSSGSPVLNMKGEVIGVATFQIVEGQNLNFAIPIAHAKSLKPTEELDMASINFSSSQLIDSMENPFDKGMVLYNRKEYEGAISFFEEAVEKNPYHAEAYYQLGLCYKEVKAVNAVDAFKKAIELKPDYAEAYFHLGTTYLVLNMQEEAIAALQKARDLRPNYDEALLNLGIAYGVAKKYRAAVSVLQKSVEIFPDARAYYYLGASYAGLQNHEKAVYAFRQSIEVDPDNLEAYIGLGASYAVLENWRQGIKTLNKAVLIDPNNSEVHYLLGILHLGNHDLESAELEYKILVNQKAPSQLRNQLNTAISRYKYAYRRRY